MKISQKIVLSVAVIIAATDISVAQHYINTPNDTIHKMGLLENMETLSIEQVNVSADTIQLQWKKVSESIPMLWEASVCDNQNCNTSLVDSGTMKPVYPSEYGLLLLHLTPHVNYGTATVRYAVWDVEFPNHIDTLTYIFTVSESAGIGEKLNENPICVFPNPAKENVNIVSSLQSGFEYVIFDVKGKQIENGISITNSVTIATEKLSSGYYYITIQGENKIMNTEKILIQK